MMKRQKGGEGRRWKIEVGGEDEAEGTMGVENRVAKTSGEISFKIHNCPLSHLHLSFKEGEKMRK